MVFQSLTRQLGESIGLTFVRLALAFVFVVSGAGKLLGIGPDVLSIADFTGFLGQLAIPSPAIFAWVVAIVELVGGLFLLVGLGTRLVSLALAADMAVATVLVHLPNGFNVADGGYEYTLVLTLCAVALVFGGPGVLSVDRWIDVRSLLSSSD